MTVELLFINGHASCLVRHCFFFWLRLSMKYLSILGAFIKIWYQVWASYPGVETKLVLSGCGSGCCWIRLY